MASIPTATPRAAPLPATSTITRPYGPSGTRLTPLLLLTKQISFNPFIFVARSFSFRESDFFLLPATLLTYRCHYPVLPLYKQQSHDNTNNHHRPHSHGSHPRTLARPPPAHPPRHRSLPRRGLRVLFNRRDAPLQRIGIGNDRHGRTRYQWYPHG